jgi:hypothetical protein
MGGKKRGWGLELGWVRLGVRGGMGEVVDGTP